MFGFSVQAAARRLTAAGLAVLGVTVVMAVGSPAASHAWTCSGAFYNGTNASDAALNGDALGNRMHGRGGNDTISAGDGRDCVWGEAGNDSIRGGEGGDKLWGGNGNDRVWGGAGSDQLRGGSGRDILRGDGSGDSLYGGLGDDNLGGGSGRDNLIGNAGADVITGGPGSDTILGGPGIDRIYAVDGEVDTIDCGSGGNSVSQVDTAWVDGFDQRVNCDQVIVGINPG